MKHQALFERHIYPLYLTLLLAWGSVLLFNDRFWMYLDALPLLLTVFILALIAHAVDCYKRHIWVIVLTALVLVGGLIAFFSAALPASGASIGLYDWWMDYGGSISTYHLEFALITVSGVIGAAVVIATILQKWLWTRLFGAATALAALCVLSGTGYSPAPNVLFLLIAYISSVLAEGLYQLASRRKRKKSSSITAVFLIPAFLLTSFVSVAVPPSKEPLNWQFVVDAYQNIVDYITHKIDDMNFQRNPGAGEFSLGMLGYSESGKLGGNLQESDRIALRVGLSERPQGGLYLAGSIQNLYTGYSWERSETLSGSTQYEIERIELIRALNRLGLNTTTAPDILIYRQATVTYEDLYTRSVLYPTKLNNIDLDTPLNLNQLMADYYANALETGVYPDEPFTPPWTQKSGHIVLDKAQGRDFTYDFGYFDLNYAGAACQEFLREQSTYHYAEHGLAQVPSNPTEDEREQANFADSMVPVVEAIHKDYLGLPEELPQRVRDLADEITQGYDNDYDKLKAIEAYLQENYEYTLSPGSVPEEQDFVDYFLFENKEGYCAYFATAMAVLARCEGIPTRYVQGFAARLERKGEDGTYAVRNREAHSWPEAYLEGIGWIQFEPTPARSELLYADWTVKFGEGSIEQQPGGSSSEEENTSPEEIEPPLPSETRTEEQDYAITIFVVAAAALLLIAVFGFIGSRIGRLKRYRRQYVKSDYQKKTYMDFYELMFMLKRYGLGIMPGETLRAYNRRVGRILEQENNISLSAAIEAYSRMYYSGKQPSGDDYSYVRSARVSVDELVRKRVGRLRYLFYRLRLSKKRQNKIWKPDE